MVLQLPLKMISLGKEITDILASDDITIAVLIDFGFPDSAGGSVRVTDSDYPISVRFEGDEEDTNYSSGTGITAISAPAQQQGLARDVYTIRHVDRFPTAVDSWRTRYTSHGWVGVNLKVDAVFRIERTGAYTSPVGVFSGHCISIVEEPNNQGGAILVANFAGDLEQIGADRVVLATDHYQRLLNNDDNSLAYIQNLTNVPWGEGPTD